MIPIERGERAVRVSVGIPRVPEPSILVTPRELVHVARRIPITSSGSEVASAIPVRTLTEIPADEPPLLLEASQLFVPEIQLLEVVYQPLIQVHTYPLTESLAPVP